MKKNSIDERVNSIELEITQLMYRLLIVILALSIICQMFVLHLPVSNYIVETIILIGVNVLEVLAYSKSGILNDGKRKAFYKKIFKDVVLSILLLSCVYFIVVGVEDYRQFFIMLVVYIILYTSFKIMINLYNCNKLDAINDEINGYED